MTEDPRSLVTVRMSGGQVTAGTASARLCAVPPGHLQRLAVLEDAAVTAERAAANPPERVPPNAWTCLLGNPLHLLMQLDLDAEGRALVAAQIGTLARLPGVADELRAEGRAQLEAE